MALQIDQIVCDAEKTFGKCWFMGYDGEKMDKNDLGDDVISARRYNIMSERQGEVIRVHVPVEVPLIDMPMRTPCKVVGELHLKFIPGRSMGMENVTFCMVDNIVKDSGGSGGVGHGVGSQSAPKQEKQENK